MKFSKTLLAAAALVASFGANAAITFSSVAASPGDYISTGDVYAHAGGGSTQTTSVVDTYLKPLYDTNNYFVVTTGETVTFTLAARAPCAINVTMQPMAVVQTPLFAPMRFLPSRCQEDPKPENHITMFPRKRA